MNKVIYSTTTQTGDDDDGIVTIPPSARHRAELARLEREIGRAVIGRKIVNDAMYYVSSRELMSVSDDCTEAIDTLITRYRALLAAGAEAATGGEES